MNNEPAAENIQPSGALTPDDFARLLAGQNLGMAVAAGAISALVGAAVWAGITVATHYQIGWMAVGIGFLVGYAVRVAGHGVQPIFGVIGAVFALLGCLLGNLFGSAGFIAIENDVSYWMVVSSITPSMALEILEVTFSPIDLLFYGIAVYEGFKFAFTRVQTQ